MSKPSRRVRENVEKIRSNDKLEVAEAISRLMESKAAKFDESVDVAIRLGVDPKQSDQVVRGVANLPHGTGKTVRVLVFAKGEKESEAKEAGADFVGAEDLVDKIKEGWLDFDKAIATPDMMPKIGPIAKILGPRGLMPNPKVGTVTVDVTKAVTEQKAGKVEFRVDKGANLHVPIGRRSFDAKDLEANLHVLIEQVVKAKPSSAKGIYLRGMSISSTMGPAVRIDTARLQGETSKE